MTENDYIAEYIKEKHKELLGLDFAIWKIGRTMADWMRNVVDIIKSIPTDQIAKILEAAQDENETETDKNEDLDRHPKS